MSGELAGVPSTMLPCACTLALRETGAPSKPWRPRSSSAAARWQRTTPLPQVIAVMSVPCCTTLALPNGIK